MTIYLFWGQEEFNLEQKMSELKNKYVTPEFATMSYKVYDGPEFEELREALCTSPFMFGSVFIRIDISKYFGGGKKEIVFTDKELKYLEEILANINENTHVAFVYKIPANTTKKIDTRKKIYKIISKYAKVEEFPQYKSYDKELLIWIKKQAKTKDINLNEQSAKVLIDTIGASLRALDNELEKLKIFKHPKKEITIEDIKTICPQGEDVFKIIDFYTSGKKDLALDEIRKLGEKQHHLATLATLNTNIRNALNIKLLAEKYSSLEISRQLGKHEYWIKLQLEKLRNVPTNNLLELKLKLTEAEYNIKSGKIATPSLALELAFL